MKIGAVEGLRDIGMIAKSVVVVQIVEHIREITKVDALREIMMENMEEKEVDMRDLEEHLVDQIGMIADGSGRILRAGMVAVVLAGTIIRLHPQCWLGHHLTSDWFPLGKHHVL